MLPPVLIVCSRYGSDILPLHRITIFRHGVWQLLNKCKDIGAKPLLSNQFGTRFGIIVHTALQPILIPNLCDPEKSASSNYGFVAGPNRGHFNRASLNAYRDLCSAFHLPLLNSSRAKRLVICVLNHTRGFWKAGT